MGSNLFGALRLGGVGHPVPHDRVDDLQPLSCQRLERLAVRHAPLSAPSVVIAKRRARAILRGLFFWRLLARFEVLGTGSRFGETWGHTAALIEPAAPYQLPLRQISLARPHDLYLQTIKDFGLKGYLHGR